MTLKGYEQPYQKTLSDVFARPVSGSIKRSDIESLFIALGAEVHEREGSRIAVLLKGQIKAFTGRTPDQPLTRGRLTPSGYGSIA